MVSILSLTKGLSFSHREHRKKEHTATRSLTPSPSPNGEGSDHQDTPICPLYA